MLNVLNHFCISSRTAKKFNICQKKTKSKCLTANFFNTIWNILATISPLSSDMNSDLFRNLEKKNRFSNDQNDPRSEEMFLNVLDYESILSSKK